MSQWRFITIFASFLLFVLLVTLYYAKNIVTEARNSQWCAITAAANLGLPVAHSPLLEPKKVSNGSTALAGVWQTEYAVPLSHSLDSRLSKAMMTAFHDYITKKDIECPNKIRPGRAGDGGYEICMLPGVAITPGSCIVYSIGIRDEWSFDDDVALNYKCEVHSFDPSMDKEDHLRSPTLHFYNVGIWDKNMVNDKGWKLKTLSTIMSELNHDNSVIDVLKMDTEGAEWPCLVEWLSSGALARFKQIAFEVHTPKLRSLGEKMSVEDHLRITWLFDELRRQGFLKYHVNTNNGCCGRFSDWANPPRVLCCYELFFVNWKYLIN